MYCGIRSDILSGIYSDILSGIYSDIFFLAFYLPSILTFYLASFQAFILAYITLWHSLWHSFWHSIWHLFWRSFWHSIWHSLWRLAEVRQCAHWESGTRGWAGARSWGAEGRGEEEEEEKRRRGEEEKRRRGRGRGGSNSDKILRPSPGRWEKQSHEAYPIYIPYPTLPEMEVSKNVPPKSLILNHFNRNLHYKPSFLGYLHFRNPPNGDLWVQPCTLGRPAFAHPKPPACCFARVSAFFWHLTQLRWS